MEMRKSNRGMFIWTLSMIPIIGIQGLTESYITETGNIFLIGFFCWPFHEATTKLLKNKIKEKTWKHIKK
jgi:hypothetical protein